MPTRQEALFHVFQARQKGNRKLDKVDEIGKKDDADVVAKDDLDVVEEDDDEDELEKDQEPSTSKQIFEKIPKFNIEEIFLNTTIEAELRVKHNLFPNFNLSRMPVENCSELKNFPDCMISIPQPVHVEGKHCETVDPCHRRPIARENHIKRLLHARTAYLNATKRNKKLRRAAEKKNQYHNSLFEFAERLEMNPDPYFNDSYDFYYTGGNLCTLFNTNYVVHAGGKNLEELNISRICNKKYIAGEPMQHLLCESLQQSGDIMQAMPFVTNRNDRPNCFVTRQRNTVSLYAYSDKENLKAITHYKNKSTPFISFAQSPVDANKFVLTNMKQHVRLFDLNSSKTSMSKLYKVVEGDTCKQWNIVRPWREHTFLYANRKELFLMDLRTGPKEWEKTKCGFGAGELYCESIANIIRSEFKKQIYIGTSHKLYCLDTRCWGQEFESSATVCCWQHQLEYPPLLLETFRHFDSEYIALSSPIADDLHICELTRAGRIITKTTKKKQKVDKTPKYNYKSLSLPYQPPTLHEAYESARLNGKCLRPYSNLQQRLNCATTGLTFYVSPEGEYDQTLLLTSNSNGDVFAHQFSHRESQEVVPRTSALTDNVIAKYEEQISRIKQPDLNFTEICDFKAMSKVFRCATLSSMNSEFDDLAEQDSTASDTNNKEDSQPIKKPRKLGRWQKSMQVLHSYKDALVPNLLSVWDIDYITEHDIKIAELDKKLRVKPDPEIMVNSWLKRIESRPPMTSLPAEKAKDYVSADTKSNASMLDEFLKADISDSPLRHVPQSTQLLDESRAQLETTLVQEQLNNSTDTTAKRRSQTKKKRKSYVKGF